ncbi:MAG: diaminopimelate epimerase [Christensenellales bacterium]|jgi:diaminopimelate epimerase
MRFTKMHGIGNDYIFINCFEEIVSNPERLALVMSRQHFGVSSDGLVLIEPSSVADFGMRIFNADGSEAEMCGNAARCIGKYAYERGLTSKTHISLETKAGLRWLDLNVQNGKVERIRVDMGSPELEPKKIPVDLPGEVVLQHRVQMLGQEWSITCVNMGNPHCIIFVKDPEILDLNTLGPMFENHPMFPHRTNVEFVRVIRRDILQMRVWERGTGETLACGTGASAAIVAAVLSGLSDRTAQVKLPGGNLELCWNADDNNVYLAGPASYVFDGEWLENIY